MARTFNIPQFYRSDIVTLVKKKRREQDPRKTDRSPTILDLGTLRFKIARHFGFCYGVENAIETAYRALAENPGKNIYLLSEMIHNARVNGDLISRGVKFLMSTKGEQLIPFDSLQPNDIVIVPAFGTTVELFALLKSKGIDAQIYNSTCPFVERVWKRAAELGSKGYTIVIHGKHDHEETRATFSHACLSGPSVVVRDKEQARTLGEYILGEKDLKDFDKDFGKFSSKDFDPKIHLDKIGVVNQTTMLATETKEIAEMLKEVVLAKRGAAEVNQYFADTRDTLCYATYENQQAAISLIESSGDLAIVVGGYNSSNTSHLVELCEEKVPTYYIKDSEEIISENLIRHFNFHSGKIVETTAWLPINNNPAKPIEILLTAGASCPDAIVDQVITKISDFFNLSEKVNLAI